MRRTRRWVCVCDFHNGAKQHLNYYSGGYRERVIESALCAAVWRLVAEMVLIAAAAVARILCSRRTVFV